MFENIGGKIKVLAQVVCWIGIVVSVIYGIKIIQTEYATEMKALGFAVAVLGSVLSWIGSFLLYGFGELIEKVTVIAEKMDPKKEGTANDVVSSMMATMMEEKKDGDE